MIRAICLIFLMLGINACAPDKDIDAYFNKGRSYFEERNYAAAYRELLPLAEQGHPGAQYYIGQLYAQGEAGLSQDMQEAFQWYLKAAEQNHPMAQYTIGTMFKYGFLGPDGPIEQQYWYLRAAEQGVTEAQLRLAEYYSEAGQDFQSAYYWYTIAISQMQKSRNESTKKITEVTMARDILAEYMSPSDIRKAETEAQKFRPSPTPVWYPGKVSLPRQ